jgi:hypothetical protein
VGRISRRTRLGDRTVQVALRRLIADHHISITGNVAGGYDKQTTTCVVHPKMASVPPGVGASLQEIQRVHHQLVDEIRRVWEGDSPANQIQGGGEPHSGGANQRHPNHH